MLLGNIITPFQGLIVLWNQLQEVAIATERIHDVLDAEPEGKRSAISYKRFKGVFGSNRSVHTPERNRL